MTTTAPTPTAHSSTGTRRIAIVGGGPRGLWAVERLLHHAARAGVGLAVEVFDPRPLGHGAAYDTAQPEAWRINVKSSVITSGLGTFDRWRARRGDPATDSFPPRALVGQFHAESWQSLFRDLPAGCTVEHHAREVTDLTPLTDGWRLETRDGQLRDYPEVLLATGHAPSWPGALPDEVGGLAPVPVYPGGDLASIAPGARVLARGAALSFLDAALALTEGRGGTFRPAGTGVVYEPGGKEPAIIVPVSRSGRFMAVKPAPGSALSGLELSATTRAGDAAVRLCTSTAELRQVLTETAEGYLCAAGVRGVDKRELTAVLDGTDGSGNPGVDLRSSLRVACGEQPPGAEWAVGEAWRRLYPAIIWRSSRGGRADLDGFHELSRTLERVAFGPPPVTAARLVALIDAGLVDTGLLAAPPGGIPEALHSVAADTLVDAVLAPQGVVPGTLAGKLVDRGLAHVATPGRGLAVERDATVTGRSGLAVVGRDTEDTVLGNDSLNRGLHDVIERWARRVVSAACAGTALESGMHGRPALTARLEPWEERLAADHRRCSELLREHGSPVNVLDPGPMERNITELVEAGADHGVPVQVFFARKANKALGFVDRVRSLGHGVDVASYRELSQVLDRGVDPRRVILSAAVKPDALLELAVTSGACVSVDTVAELHRLAELAAAHRRRVRVAPRLAPDPATLPPTRFGETLRVWEAAMPELPAGVDVVGVHVHLHGYAAADRRSALAEALRLIDAAARAHQHPEFVDLGGGVPMSYLDDPAEWERFRAARRAMNAGEREPFTWKADPLDHVYPFHQAPTRGDWLRELLAGALPDTGETAAAGLIRRGLRLHLEPGRSVLDGCGMILAEVAFTKTRSDGLPLVGLAMNRTQCRTTSDDILLDPVLVQDPGAPERTAPSDGFLVGAYCIEDEVIVRRRMHFPAGVTAGDVVAIPNTAGYFMHILESASHQIPLARNVLLDTATGGAVLDDIDALPPR